MRVNSYDQEPSRRGVAALAYLLIPEEIEISRAVIAILLGLSLHLAELVLVR
jgi:hypothetical protein